MLILITYDVSTETETGKRRLRKVAKQCVKMCIRDSIYPRLCIPTIGKKF